MVDLQSVHLDLDDILDDLRISWSGNPESALNNFAFSKRKTSGDHIMFCCPYHEETNPSCGIMTEHPFGFNCFGCGMTGTIDMLVAHALALPSELHGRRYLIKQYASTERTERPKLNAEDILDGRDADKKRSLPDSEVEKYMGNAHPYLGGRGFSRWTQKKYETGYDPATQSVTFPVRTSKGLLRFIKRRNVNRKMFLNEEKIYKKDIVYGLWYILNSPTPIRRIKLNESETDTIACYEGKLPAGALLGRLMFKEQVIELLKAGINTVDLFLDNDIHGVHATIKAYQLISKMSPIRVNVVIYPGGHWGIDETDPEVDMAHKDANDLLRAGMLGQLAIVSYEKFAQMLKVTEAQMDEYFRRVKRENERS